MNRTMAPKSLEDILDRQIQQMEAVMTASEALQKAVIHNDHDALQAANAQMSDAQAGLSIVEEERLQLMAQEGRQDISMSDYILQSEASRREGLTRLFSRLSNLTIMLKNLQEANTMLLREGLSYIQVQLATICPETVGNKGIYSRHGTLRAQQGLSLDTRG